MVNGGIVKRLCCEGARLLLIVSEGRCAFKSRPPLDPLIDIVLSQCMHCPAMTDIVPVENLYIGAPHRTTQSPTQTGWWTAGGWKVVSINSAESNRRSSSSSPGWIDASIMWSSGKRNKIMICFCTVWGNIYNNQPNSLIADLLVYWNILKTWKWDKCM